MIDESTHETFTRGLLASNYPVWLAACWLDSMGYDVEMHYAKPSPTHAEWKNHSDDGDLRVNGRRVEVKGLSRHWTCADDWPFKRVPRDQQFIICTQFSHDRANPVPVKYIYWNRAFTHVAIVLTKTQRQWTTMRVTDSRYGANKVIEQVYCCALDHVEFRHVHSTPPRRIEC